VDHDRFDRLARLVGAPSSRRGTLRALATGVLAAVASTVSLDDALGRKRKRKPKSKPKSEAPRNRCARFCKNLPPGPQRGRCRSGCARGKGLFAECEGDADRLCERPSGAFVCCDDGEACVDGTCATPAPGCVDDADCDDGDPCTLDTCNTATGACRHEAIPDCGGVCTCPDGLKEIGEGCQSDDECCSTFCDFSSGTPTCRPGEGCLSAGSPCAGGPCCSGLCGEDCRCTCLDAGDKTCQNDNQCCGGLCAPDGCCAQTDNPCGSDADCCGGHCGENGRCEQGAAGTVCRNAGDCINDCDDTDTCTCSTDNWCYDDGDCCEDFRCIADPNAAPFTGVCGT